MALPRLAALQFRRACLARRWACSSSRALAGLNPVSEADLAHFARILPESAILSTLPPRSLPADDLAIYNEDWMGKYKGKASTVIRPRTTEEVSAIIKWCWEKRIAVVPQGGNTGLVGGSVPINNELVISLGSMSKVRSFDPVTGILVADAGCVLEALSEYIAPHNHIMPLDLGAKGSCMIGGNVATNAGGLRLLRYGSLHGSVLGLEVVLPDGTILNQLTELRKDNTGYDLKQLFIGSEGTLGIITGVSILTAAAPRSSNNVFLALPSFKNVLPVYMKAKQHLSEILSAFEFIDRNAYDLAVKHGQGKALDDQEVEGAECFVLLETSGGKREHDEEKLNELLELLLESEEPLINTGVLSQSPSQFASIWALREGITEAVSKEGKAYKYDISIPLTAFKDVVDKTREHLQQNGLIREGAVRHVIGYGHVGDGNLHLNIVADHYLPEIQDALEPFVYEVVASYQGSISAEHGIGVMKTHALHYSKDDIFESDGHPVKFFLQKDIPDFERVTLGNSIRNNGGLLVEKVPIRGYVVISPGTPEADRLEAEWRVEDRPHRYFVPCSWIQACLECGSLIPQVFIKDKYPVRIHIHRSIANVVSRQELADKISLHGGNPNASFDEATVILASKDTEAYKTLRKDFQGREAKFVESLQWLDTCIEQQLYHNSPNPVRNPGGRRAGDERMPFTEEDEANLCKWIASVIPNKHQGGRTGNKIYMELVSRVDQPGYEWVKRHTWQSWRERYKKNAERLDRHIAAIVDVGQTNGTIPQESSQFGYFKLTEGRQSQKSRNSQKRKASEEPVVVVRTNGEGSNNVQDTQDSEWAIREGNGPVPDWARRNEHNDADPELHEMKRQKTGDGTFRTFVLTPAEEGPSGPPVFATATEFAADFGHPVPLDPIEQEIIAIARDQRFLPDEVRAYFNRNGDLVSTRQRFERVRALIDSLP
ncbi:DLD2 [Sanghuangporus weigelae]